MNQFPNPKKQIRSERPAIPAMGINWLDENGKAEGRIVRLDNKQGTLAIIGRHGLAYKISEEDLRGFCRARCE